MGFLYGQTFELDTHMFESGRPRCHHRRQVVRSARRNQVFNVGGLTWLWDVSTESCNGPLLCASTALARAG
eukprot:11341162-Heterocapsa_arctica.AAC.1